MSWHKKRVEAGQIISEDFFISGFFVSTKLMKKKIKPLAQQFIYQCLGSYNLHFRRMQTMQNSWPAKFYFHYKIKYIAHLILILCVTTRSTSLCVKLRKAGIDKIMLIRFSLGTKTQSFRLRNCRITNRQRKGCYTREILVPVQGVNQLPHLCLCEPRAEEDFCHEHSSKCMLLCEMNLQPNITLGSLSLS